MGKKKTGKTSLFAGLDVDSSSDDGDESVQAELSEEPGLPQVAVRSESGGEAWTDVAAAPVIDHDERYDSALFVKPNGGTRTCARSLGPAGVCSGSQQLTNGSGRTFGA